MKRILTLFITLINVLNLTAQTCCSGGVPVSNNIGFSNESSKTLQLGLIADFNVLKDLYSESILLNDQQRKRTTQSYLLRSAYSISERISIETSVALVRQTRKIYSANGTDVESTFGIGDPVLLIIYDVIKNPLNLRLGLGTQVPLGSTEERNSRGLFLVEDLQPGSGALDLLLYGSIHQSLYIRPSLNFFLNTIYSRTGVNNSSRGGGQTYQFGDDIQVIAGINDQFDLFNQILTFGMGARYRKAMRDKVNNFDNSGTGGEFLFLRSNLGWNLSDHLNISINTELPLYTKVNETQLATSYTLNIGIFKKLKIGEKPSLIPDMGF